jgi:hypothetical protein
MKWSRVFKQRRKEKRMSRRKGETIKQYDLRKIDEELQRLTADEPEHVRQDLAFCSAMVRAGYKQVEREEVTE